MRRHTRSKSARRRSNLFIFEKCTHSFFPKIQLKETKFEPAFFGSEGGEKNYSLLSFIPTMDTQFNNEEIKRSPQCSLSLLISFFAELVGPTVESFKKLEIGRNALLPLLEVLKTR